MNGVCLHAGLTGCCSTVGHVDWPSKGATFSHVNRWFFFLNSQVPFSAVGNKYTKKSLPLTKSNVSVSAARQGLLCLSVLSDAILSRDGHAHTVPIVFPFNSPRRRSKMLASSLSCRVLKWAKWWFGSPLKPAGKVGLKGSS